MQPKPEQPAAEEAAAEGAAARAQEPGTSSSPARDLLALLCTSRRFYALRGAVTQHLRRAARRARAVPPHRPTSLPAQAREHVFASGRAQALPAPRSSLVLCTGVCSSCPYPAPPDLGARAGRRLASTGRGALWCSCQPAPRRGASQSIPTSLKTQAAPTRRWAQRGPRGVPAGNCPSRSCGRQSARTSRARRLHLMYLIEQQAIAVRWVFTRPLSAYLSLLPNLHLPFGPSHTAAFAGRSKTGAPSSGRRRSAPTRAPSQQARAREGQRGAVAPLFSP